MVDNVLWSESQHHMEKNRGDHHQLDVDPEWILVLNKKKFGSLIQEGPNIYNAQLTAKKCHRSFFEGCSATFALYTVLHINRISVAQTRATTHVGAHLHSETCSRYFSVWTSQFLDTDRLNYYDLHFTFPFSNGHIMDTIIKRIVELRTNIGPIFLPCHHV